MGTIGLASAALALSFLARPQPVHPRQQLWADEIASIEDAPRLRPPVRPTACGRSPSPSVPPSWRSVWSPIRPSSSSASCCSSSPAPSGLPRHGRSGHRPTPATTPRFATGSPTRSSSRWPAAIGIGVVVYAFSRVMLFLSKTNTVIAFAVLGSIIIALAFLFAYRRASRPRLRRS